MPSQNVQTLVNKILSMDGEYSALADVTVSPAGVGERIVTYLNIILEEILSSRNVSILTRVHGRNATAGAKQYLVDPLGIVFDVHSIRGVRLAGIGYTETTQQDLHSQKNKYVYTRGEDAQGVYVEFERPLAVGETFSVLVSENYPEFLVNNASTIPMSDINNILILGACKYLDNYREQDRGYARLYQSALSDLFMRENKNVRNVIIPDGYV